jgi:hypothetical protein
MHGNLREPGRLKLIAHPFGFGASLPFDVEEPGKAVKK